MRTQNVPFPQSERIKCPSGHRLLLNKGVPRPFFLPFSSSSFWILQEQILPLPVPNAPGSPQRVRGFRLTCDLIFGTCGTCDLMFGTRSWDCRGRILGPALEAPNPPLLLSRLKVRIERRCYLADAAVPPPKVVVALVARRRPRLG